MSTVTTSHDIVDEPPRMRARRQPSKSSGGSSDHSWISVEERRTHILRATAQCIAKQGYDGVRLRDVSHAAGVSVGLIQHYFDTRDVLLREAIKHLSEQLTGRFTSVDTHMLGAWERIEILVDQLCAVPDLEAHGFMWIAFAAAVSKHPELGPDLESVYQSWEEYVAAAVDHGVETGEFDLAGSRDDVIAVLLAFFDGYEYDMGTGLVAADPNELRDRALLTARALFRPTSA